MARPTGAGKQYKEALDQSEASTGTVDSSVQSPLLSDNQFDAHISDMRLATANEGRDLDKSSYGRAAVSNSWMSVFGPGGARPAANAGDAAEAKLPSDDQAAVAREINKEIAHDHVRGMAHDVFSHEITSVSQEDLQRVDSNTRSEIENFLKGRPNEPGVLDDDEEEGKTKDKKPKIPAPEWLENNGDDDDKKHLRSRLLRGLAALLRAARYALKLGADEFKKIGRYGRESGAARDLRAAEREAGAARDALSTERGAETVANDTRLAGEAARGMEDTSAALRVQRAERNLASAADAAKIARVAREAAEIPRTLRVLRLGGVGIVAMAVITAIPAAIVAGFVAKTAPEGQDPEKTKQQTLSAFGNVLKLSVEATPEERQLWDSGQKWAAIKSYSGIPQTADFLKLYWNDKPKAMAEAKEWAQAFADIGRDAYNNPEPTRRAALALGTAANDEALIAQGRGAIMSGNKDDALRAARTALGNQTLVGQTQGVLDAANADPSMRAATGNVISMITRRAYAPIPQQGQASNSVGSGDILPAPAPSMNSRGNRQTLSELNAPPMPLRSNNINIFNIYQAPTYEPDAA